MTRSIGEAEKRGRECEAEAGEARLKALQAAFNRKSEALRDARARLTQLARCATLLITRQSCLAKPLNPANFSAVKRLIEYVEPIGSTVQYTKDAASVCFCTPVCK